MKLCRFLYGSEFSCYARFSKVQNVFYFIICLFFSLQTMNPFAVLTFVLYIIGSLTTIGMLFENKPHACVFELLRCMILVTAVQRLEFPDVDANILLAVEVFFLTSGLFWLLQCMKVLQITKQKTH